MGSASSPALACTVATFKPPRGCQCVNSACELVVSATVGGPPWCAPRPETDSGTPCTRPCAMPCLPRNHTPRRRGLFAFGRLIGRTWYYGPDRRGGGGPPPAIFCVSCDSRGATYGPGVLCFCVGV